MIKTDDNTVIGLYSADKWEDTNKIDGKYKNCVGGKPFLFYCLDNKIEMITHRDDKTPSIGSNETYLISIADKFRISNDKEKHGVAVANKNYFNFPVKIGSLQVSGDELYFAGGKDSSFNVSLIEVWGLNKS